MNWKFIGSLLVAMALGYGVFFGVRHYEYQCSAAELATKAVGEALEMKLGDPVPPTLQKIEALPEGQFKELVRDEIAREVVRRHGGSGLRRLLIGITGDDEK